MSDSKEKGLMVLATGIVNLQNGDAKTTVLNLPSDKLGAVKAVLIHSPSGSLAGGTDFDIGSGANADTWRQTNNLADMTATTSYRYITSDDTTYTIEPNSAAFGIKPITGATADVTATMVVFGILI